MPKEIRFVVGTKDDIRSSVWRLWSEAKKNDLFLAARSSAGVSKISFHRSGIYRIAIVANDGAPRPALYKWRRGVEPRHGGGLEAIFRIVVPAVPLDGRFQDELPSANKSIVFIDPPGLRAKQVIVILLADTSVTAEDVFRRGEKTKPVKVLGCVPMARENAWLVTYKDKFDVDELANILKTITSVKVQYTELPSREDIAFMHVHALKTPKNIAPYFVDLQLGPNNLELDADAKAN